MQKAREQALKYYYAHRDERLEYYKKNREKEIKSRRKYRGENVDAPIPPYGLRQLNANLYSNLSPKELKALVTSNYGSKCECCGETIITFLTIDHINNDGHTYKAGKTRLKGISLYQYIIRENYPKNVRLLCFNCNIGRHNNGGVCPHKR